MAIVIVLTFVLVWASVAEGLWLPHLSPHRHHTLLSTKKDAHKDEYYLHKLSKVEDWCSKASARKINPLQNKNRIRDSFFIPDDEAVLKSVIVNASDKSSVPQLPVAFVRAGPRKTLYFDPEDVVAAVVTCGGLAPGINTVIRELVQCLEFQYGVRRIWGVHHGFEGFYGELERSGELGWTLLTADSVDQIHVQGGTVLGSSRGGHDTEKILNALELVGVNMLFVIGGDGTMRGGSVLAEGAKQRGLRIAIAGIPKTVDNDIPIIDKSFGFETAVEEAQKAITSAAVEARAFPNGIGLVQLMGRNSGFIALHATLASREVDCLLIPEINFDVPELMAYLEGKLREKKHVVVVVAEGAGQEHVVEANRERNGTDTKHDASGNKLLNDVGIWLSNEIKRHFAREPALKPAPTVKYINPTYMIRSVPANSADSIFCTTLAQSAAHAAMAGYTDFMVGPVNGHNTYIPLGLIFGSINVVSVSDEVI
jgi:6-phosphofructokinase 1